MEDEDEAQTTSPPVPSAKRAKPSPPTAAAAQAEDDVLTRCKKLLSGPKLVSTEEFNKLLPDVKKYIQDLPNAEEIPSLLLILDNSQHQLFSQAMYLQDLITERMRTHYKFPTGFKRLSMLLPGAPQALRNLGNPEAERMCSDCAGTQEDVLNFEFVLLDSNSRLLLTIAHVLSLVGKQSATLDQHMASETAKILSYELVDLFNFVTDLCKFAHLIGVEEASGNEEILKPPSDLPPIVHQLTAAKTPIRSSSIKSQKLRINSMVSVALEFMPRPIPNLIFSHGSGWQVGV